MSDTYHFNFFNPGKNYFTKKELDITVKNLKSFGFEISPGNFPHKSYQNGKFAFQEKETRVDFDILYNPDPGFTFSLSLKIPDEDEDFDYLKTRIASLYVEEQQIEYKDETLNTGTVDEENVPFSPSEITTNCQIFYKAAVAVMYGLQPYFAWGDHEFAFKDEVMDSLSFDKVGALVWMNMFSFEFVEKLGGLDKVLLFPNPEVEKAYENAKKTGEYMFAPLQLAENPLEKIPEEIRKKM